ncbi:TVP38/TMEM64 family protein [Kordiimonas sp. SCSIO 12610]|uniref:TVP38/TMEM64 family protein n=1 Tax=Kordiimonas sp. SCSIO 12610 TaxID=2829597 RepID=UPI002109FEC6|nr:TVP38/TMEM64 family protein [Kordiimonas sp. SCSIO 12610]UTW55908.1 TVP38/TMEM64 family protein [Kordiimonas sp. SCSIO 12610]
MTTPTEHESTAAAKPAWKRFLPIGIIVIALIAFFATGLNEYFTVDAIAENQSTLKEFARDNLVLAMLAVVVIYAIATAISAPVGSIFTLLSGFILGTLYGGIAVVVGATIGATIIFYAGREAAGDTLAKLGGEKMKNLEEGFAKDAMSYMFILRLVPLFPFFVVNLAAAAFRVPAKSYVIATFFGIMPGTFVFASVGAGFSSITESENIGAGILLQPEIIGPIIGLVVLSLVPIIYKKIKGEDTAEPSENGA